MTSLVRSFICTPNYFSETNIAARPWKVNHTNQIQQRRRSDILSLKR